MAAIISSRVTELYKLKDGARREQNGRGKPAKAKTARNASPRKSDASVATAWGAKLMDMIINKQFDEATILLKSKIQGKANCADVLPGTILITAVDHIAPVNFLNVLIEAVPESINKRDRKGKAAIHSAVRCHHAAVAVLVEKNPNALLTASLKGLMPIHYACRHRAPLHVIETMALHLPASLRVTTKLGWTPLHMAISNRAPDDTIIRLCTSTNLRVKTLDGSRLPIHIAAVAGCTLKVAQQVLEQYPEGTKVRDAYGKTALDYMIDYKRWELSKIFFAKVASAEEAAGPRKKRLRTYTMSRESTSSRAESGSTKRARQRIASVSF